MIRSKGEVRGIAKAMEREEEHGNTILEGLEDLKEEFRALLGVK